jgi:zinc transport system ATP-binding protein
VFSENIMTRKVVKCKKLSVSYGKRVILNDISFVLSEKEIVTIIGPNGSGKSSLLRVVCGLQQATSGVVEVEKKLIIGYMPQKLHIDKVLPLTVKRFLCLNGMNEKLQSADKVYNIARKFDIMHLLYNQIHDISGGEMQRVMLARALLLNPDLLVLDEPTQGLDIQGQAEFYSLIEEVRKEYGCAILMVSHDLNMVMASTDRVLCINHHICCEGAPEDINEHPEYIALFGKKNAEKVAVYTHKHDHTHGPDGCVDGVGHG